MHDPSTSPKRIRAASRTSVCAIAAFIFVASALIPSASAAPPFTVQPMAPSSPGNIGYYPSLIVQPYGFPHIAYHARTGGELRYATYDALGWTIVTVDDGGGDDVGWNSSLAVDSGVIPHISYLDFSNLDLKYATKISGWWTIEVVDSAGAVGSRSSLVLDSTETPHVAYDGTTGAELKYAVRSGGTWTIEVVYTDEPVTSISLALDSLDQPHISFGTNNSKNLMYATKFGGSWTVTPVTGSSGDVAYLSRIRLDSSDNPRIIFDDDTAGTLRYAVKGGSIWSTGTVIDSNGPYGSLDFILDDLDRPHMAYSLWGSGTTFYTWRSGMVWEAQQMDSASTMVSFGLDQLRQPYIAAYDTEAEALKYSRRKSGTWLREYVDGYGNPGASICLEVDSSNKSHAVYHTLPSQILIYAKPGSGFWNQEVITDLGPVFGSKISMVLDSSNEPRIAFRRDPLGSGRVVYAQRSGGNWSFANISSPAGSAGDVDLALGLNEYPSIAFQERDNRDLSYASYDGVTWSVELVDTAGDVGDRCTLAMDAAGDPHIGYLDETNDRIRYATKSGGPWTIEILPITGTTSTLDPPCAIAIDGADVIHLAFVLDGDVQIASRTGGTWTTTPLRTREWPRYSLDLVMDENDRPHVGFYDDRESRILYGVETDLGWSFQYAVEPVTQDRRGLAILLSSNRNPRLGYYDATQAGAYLAARLESPDLRLSTAAVPTPRAFVAGEIASMSEGTLFNDGNVDLTAPISYGYYLSADNVLDGNDQALAQDTTPALLGYGAAPLPARNLQIPPATIEGNYFLGVLVDDLDAVTEYDESNNDRSSSIEVYAPIWIDVTNAALADFGNIQGVAWGDYDNDGDDDLYRAELGHPNILYRNDAGTFVDVTPVPLGDTGSARGTAWGDYDNDGDPDLLLINATTGDDKLYRNDGGGSFSDATPLAMVDATATSVCGAWGDYDNDGDLDLYITRANKANLLLRNDGGGAWTDATAAPLDDTSYSKGAAWVDVDGDDDLDLYVVNVNAPNRLFRNVGAGSFFDVSAPPLNDSGNGQGSTWGDYDNDGDLDVYIVNYTGSANRLLRNDGFGGFTVVDGPPSQDSDQGGGAAWGDYDNDGDLDLFLTRYQSDNRLFRNDGSDTFVDTAAREVGGDAWSNDVAWADYDGDGLLDIALANQDGTQLLRNTLVNGNHWLHLKLHGTTSNASGFGAKVRLVIGSTSQLRVSGGEAGYQSQGSAAVEFGLGSAAIADTIEIRWPSRITQLLFGIPADQVLDVTEPQQDWIDITQGEAGGNSPTRGFAWADADGDGDDDLYEVNIGGQANRLLERVGYGLLSDVTVPPLDDSGEGRAAVWGDMDNDGDPDLFIANATLSDRLLRNDGPSGFVDITTAPLDVLAPSVAAYWIDVDSDGLLDLHVIRAAASDALYRNMGGGSFDEITPPSLGDSGWGRSAAWGDYDGDGDLDAYLVKDGQANRLLRNDGGGSFTDATPGVLADPFSGSSAAWGDFDEDGDLDLYLTNDGSADRLFRNDAGSFVDITAPPLGHSGAGRSVVWVDTDNDGDLDLHLTVDGAGSLLYRNDGAGGFSDVTTADLAFPTDAGAAAWADVDDDGDLDLAVASSSGSNRLLRNGTTSGQHWLHLRLRGTISNRSAIGARVTLTLAGSSRIREINAGDGLRSQQSPTVEFGLGAATTVDEITVRWPSGQVQTLVQIAADQVLDVTETPWSDISTDLTGGSHQSRSVAWGDYDSDGLMDLFVCNYIGNNFLLHNDDGSTFSNANSSAPGPYLDTTIHATWGDMDNDGDPELFVSNNTGEFPGFDTDCMLWENLAGTSLVDITVPIMQWDPLTVSRAHDVDWIDYDGDGDLDLYLLAMRNTNRMLRNDGGGVFTLDTPIGLASSISGPEAAWADFDNDGDLDVYILHRSGSANEMIRNDGGGVFTDVTTPPTAIMTGDATGVCWGDYDNDGDLDLYVVLFNEPNRLLRNDGAFFTTMNTAPLNAAGNGNGAAWGDYDNDGWLDLFVANLAGDDRLFHNEGGGVFTDDMSAGEVTTHFGTYSGAWADYDNDGDLDLYVAGDGRNQLWRNERRSDAHWLQVELVGTVSNRDAVGARVRIVAGGMSQIRERSDDAGGLSKNSPILHFGLGSATMVDSIIVRWPSGLVEVGVGAMADQRVTATEGGGMTDAPSLPSSRFILRTPMPNPFNALTRIRFELPAQYALRLEVFDVSGRLVKVLIAGDTFDAGPHAVPWDARDASGSMVSSGVYYYRLQAGPHHATGRMVLVK